LRPPSQAGACRIERSPLTEDTAGGQGQTVASVSSGNPRTEALLLIRADRPRPFRRSTRAVRQNLQVPNAHPIIRVPEPREAASPTPGAGRWVGKRCSIAAAGSQERSQDRPPATRCERLGDRRRGPYGNVRLHLPPRRTQRISRASRRPHPGNRGDPGHVQLPRSSRSGSPRPREAQGRRETRTHPPQHPRRFLGSVHPGPAERLAGAVSCRPPQH
jgi:hypothetical protein